MNIVIASDHSGFNMKQFLIDKLSDKHNFIDLGTNSAVHSVDYNDYADLLVQEVLENKIFGVLICYTGIGMSIAANRHKFIRAALCNDYEAARLSREHNDANVLVLSCMIDFIKSAEILNTFISTSFSNEERHIRRVQKLTC